MLMYCNNLSNFKAKCNATNNSGLPLIQERNEKSSRAGSTQKGMVPNSYKVQV